MSTFAFTELVNDPLARVEMAALGVDAAHPFAQNDVGKAVKLATGAGANFIICATTDEIEGFVSSVEPQTVNSGFSFGGVRRNGRIIAKVGSNQTGTCDVGEYVVADTQVALGTAGYPIVMTGTPTKHLWRNIRILSGTGAAGDLVLLEKI